MASTPIKFLGIDSDGSGNDGSGVGIKKAQYQEFTTTEENYLAYQAGLRLAADSDVASLTLTSSGNQSVGTYSNTRFDQAVGTHGTTLTTSTTTTSLYQDEGTADTSGANYRKPIHYLKDGSKSQFHEMTSSEINTLTDRLISRIFTSDYPGTFRLGTSAPSGDYSAFLNNVFTDTRTDGHSQGYTMYRRDTMSAPTVVKPLHIKRSAGKTGTYQGLQQMTTAQMNYTFGQTAKNRIMNGTNGVGTYLRLSSSQGNPNANGYSGTWVAKGTASDTKQSTTSTAYTRVSTRTRVSNYAREYAGNYSRTFVGNYSRDYEGNYARAYTRTRGSTYSRDRDSNFTRNSTRDSTADFARNFTRNRESTYSRNFTRIAIVLRSSNYTRTRIETYSRNFAGNFAGDFTGNYTRAFVRNRSSAYTGESTITRASNYARQFARTFVGNYAGNFSGDFAGNFLTGYARNFSRIFAGNYTGTRDYTRISTRNSTRISIGIRSSNYARIRASNFTRSYTRQFTDVGPQYVGNYVRARPNGSPPDAYSLSAPLSYWQIKTGGSDVGKITVYYKGYAVLVNSFIGDDDNIGESMARNNVTGPDGNDYVKGDFKASTSDSQYYAVKAAADGWFMGNYTRTKVGRDYVVNYTGGTSSPITPYYDAGFTNSNNSRPSGGSGDYYWYVYFPSADVPTITVRWNNSNVAAGFESVGPGSSPVTQLDGTSDGYRYYRGDSVYSGSSGKDSFVYYKVARRSESTNYARTLYYTRNFTRTSSYSRSFARNFEGNYARSFTGNYTGDFTGNYTGNYTGGGSDNSYNRNFTRNRTANYSRDYTRVTSTRTSTRLSTRTSILNRESNYTRNSSRDFTRISIIDYSRNFEGNYTREYTRDSNRTSTRTSSRNYTRSFEGDYARIFTGNYSGQYEGNFARIFTGEYARNYLGNFTGDFTGNYTATFVGNYSRDFVGNYSRNFTRTSTRIFAGNYSRNYVGNYSRNFTRGFAGNYTGNYTGEQIDSGNTTVETYTLYVRTA